MVRDRGGLVTKVSRKVTYKLYPNKAQAIALREMLVLHQRLYNACLEQRRNVWEWRKRIETYRKLTPEEKQQCDEIGDFYGQRKQLKDVRSELAEYAALSQKSLELTFQRLDRAYKNFFRRLREGKTARELGFPRFKSLDRFPGFGFRAHGNGWQFTPGSEWKHGRLRIKGIEGYRCGIAAGDPAHARHAQPFGPDLQLGDGPSTVSVGRHEEHRTALALEPVRQFGGGRGLPHPVDPDYQNDRGSGVGPAQVAGRISVGQQGPQPVVEGSMEVVGRLECPAAHVRLETFDQVHGGGHAEVRLDQQPFQGLEVLGPKPTNQRTDIGQCQPLDASPQAHLLCAESRPCHSPSALPQSQVPPCQPLGGQGQHDQPEQPQHLTRGRPRRGRDCRRRSPL